MEKLDLTICNDEQLIYFLYLKDELMHVCDEFRLVNSTNTQVFMKLKTRLNKLNQMINAYVKRSKNWFPIICLDSQIIEPQDQKELKTNISRVHLADANIIFDGFIPSAGNLQLSYEDNELGTKIIVKNNLSRDILDSWELVGYNCNTPTMITKYFEPGAYVIEKETIVGIGKSKQLKLVKRIK